MQDSSSWKIIVLIIGASLVLFVGLTWLVVRAPQEGLSPVEQVSFQDNNDPSLGPTSTEVTVHMYSDFQCPACRSAEAGLAPSIEAYKDRVRFVWKDFPLEQIHPFARLAANAARCAQSQNKFWEYRKVLFDEQPNWTKDANVSAALVRLAQNVSLDVNAFQSCLDSRSRDNLVIDNLNEAGKNRVDRTPTFFINNQRAFGMSPEEWRRALDVALSAQK